MIITMKLSGEIGSKCISVWNFKSWWSGSL